MRRWLLVLLVAAPALLRGQAQSAQKALAFEVASVKPNTSGDDSVARIPSPRGVNITNATLQMMMRWAYRVQDFQIIDGPSWLTSARFDVVGKADTSVSEEVLHFSQPFRSNSGSNWNRVKAQPTSW